MSGRTGGGLGGGGGGGFLDGGGGAAQARPPFYRNYPRGEIYSSSFFSCKPGNFACKFYARKIRGMKGGKEGSQAHFEMVVTSAAVLC